MSTAASLLALERRLLQTAEPGTFTSTELVGLPEPARRHLTQAIASGTPLALCAQLRMRGSIKVGRWLPFRARQVLTPHQGFVWAGRAAGVIAGSDRYFDGVGGMDWRLAGLLTVAHGEGPDVSRSAAGRAGAEALWVPTALLPRFGVRWSASDADHATACYWLGEVPLEVHYRLGRDGRVMSFVFDRWGDPDGGGTWAWHPFGGQVTGYRTFDGVTIPSAGRVGWFFGTDRWTRCSTLWPMARNEPCYNPRMLRAEKLSPGPVGLGTRFRDEIQSMRRPAEITIELTGYERPRRLTSSIRLSMTDIRGTLAFDPVPGGTGRSEAQAAVTPAQTITLPFSVPRSRGLRWVLWSSRAGTFGRSRLLPRVAA